MGYLRYHHQVRYLRPNLIESFVDFQYSYFETITARFIEGGKWGTIFRESITYFLSCTVQRQQKIVMFVLFNSTVSKHHPREVIYEEIWCG